MRQIRRDPAPRLIDWTGERMVPWAPDIQVIYEHLQRYYFAACLATGRRVLDVGSGEGYGTAILAATAESAVGIELDEQTVLHSRASYTAANLEFRQGSALDLSDFADGEFGLIACFEVIEHIAEQEQLLDEIARVLAPGGILMCSTPDRVEYSGTAEQDNPFHVRELDEPGFRELLDRRFAHVRLWGQRTTTGATMYPLEGEAGQGETFFIERDGEDWSRTDPPRPLYMIAAASVEPLPQIPGHVAIADPGISLVRTVERRAEEARAAAEARLVAATQRSGALERELRDATTARSVETRARLAALADLERNAADLQGHIRYLYDEIAIMHFDLRRVHASVAWRMLEQARTRLKRPDGERNLLGRVVSKGLSRAAPLLRGAAETAPPAPDTADPVEELLRLPPPHFPEYEDPKVSIVIPVHDQPDATRMCLQALSVNTDDVSYEVIVVDDASGSETVEMLQRVRGLRLLRNDENQGFLRTSNRGAAAARGEHVVFLNNDTEVQAGWLSALVNLVESADDVGAVGGKLLLPDGRVQEAGGIVWRDGGARHVGRGEHPQEAELNYVREVDYCSAACLLVRGDVLRSLGGFDDRYAPAYYEDADLCFSVRAQGLRVLYQPRCEVVHHEGTSHGLDVTQGVKSNQVRNAAVFADKWRDTLEREQLIDDVDAIARAADRARGPRVLVVDHCVPRVSEDAGSLRMYEMLLALRELGCRVTLIPDNRDRSEPHTTDLQQAGIEVLYGHFDERHYIRGLGSGLDLAILSRPTVAWRYLHLLREFAPGARVVYDTVDLHYVREMRRATAQAERKFERVSDGFRELELGMIRVSDETIAVSDEERRMILAEVPGACVTVLPTINRVVDATEPAGGRSGLMFLGGFRHTPNCDTAIHLVENLLPRIRAELGPVGLAIVGSHPTAAVRALADVPGVEVPGFVEDLTPWFQRSRLMAAPLLYGAGVKGKLTHSMASGLPVVTTPLGAEGLHARSEVELLIAADDTAFVEAVVRLYRDDELWTTLSAAGRALAARCFGPQVARTALAEIVARTGEPAAVDAGQAASG